MNAKQFQSICKRYKNVISNCIYKNKFEQVCSLSKKYCNFLRTINLLLYDEELESMLSTYAGNHFSEAKVKASDECILFYDAIAIENMALSYQYLNYLLNSGRKFVYVTYGFKPESKLYQMALECVNCEIKTINSNKSNHEKIEELIELIEKAQPSKAILHMGNADIVGYMAFSVIKGIPKYFVNHGDEQFWIGASIIDYSLEFRGLGYTISTQNRRLDPNKVIYQPYYPIIDYSGNADMTHTETTKTIVFSGGRFVKAYGRNGAFLQLIKKLLESNPNLQFLYAGNGNGTSMRKYIKKNKLEDRWSVIPYTKSLPDLMKTVDIYVSTYPLIGGLMSQTAAFMGVPIVELDPGTGNSSRDILPKYIENDISFPTVESFVERINYLSNMPIERVEFGQRLKRGLISPEEFNKNLDNILNGGRGSYIFKDYAFDLELAGMDYLSAENNYLHTIHSFLREKELFIHYPLQSLYHLVVEVFYRIYHKLIRT